MYLDDKKGIRLIDIFDWSSDCYFYLSQTGQKLHVLQEIHFLHAHERGLFAFCLVRCLIQGDKVYSYNEGGKDRMLLALCFISCNKFM